MPSTANSLSQTPVLVSPAETVSDNEDPYFGDTSASEPPPSEPNTPASAHSELAPEMAEPPRCRYPLRNERDAPTFTGSEKSAKEIKRYLEDIEALVSQCEVVVTDRVCISKAKYYSSSEVEEKFDSIKEEEWAKFVEKATEMYAGKSDRKYTRATIKALVTKQSIAGIPTKEALLQYHQDFKVQSGFVADIAPSEVSSWYMLGLPRVIERRLRDRLRVKYVDHYESDPYKLDDLFTETVWLYEGGLGNELGENKAAEEVFGSAEGSYGGSGTGYEGRRTEVERKEVVVKTEVPDYTSLTDALKSISSMMAVLSQNQLAAAAPQPSQYSRPPNHVYAPASTFIQPAPVGFPAGPSGGLAGFPAPPSSGCRFCGQPGHFIHECPNADEYLRTGKAIRNATGQITLPNGAFLPKVFQGSWLQEGFDNFYRARPHLLPSGTGQGQDRGAHHLPSGTRQSPDMGMNWFTTTEEPRDCGAEDEVAECEDAELKALEVLAAAANGRVQQKKREKFDGVVINQKKGPPGVPSAQIPPAATKTVAPDDLRARVPRETPQFRYQAPAEDKLLVQAVINWSLDGSITVSQKELLAIAPKVRKHIKELTTSKRLPQNLVETLLSGAEVMAAPEAKVRGKTGGTVVGVDCLPLRCIEGIVEGQKLQMVLDSGSSLIAMDQRTWTAIQLPMKPTHKFSTLR